MRPRSVLPIAAATFAAALSILANAGDARAEGPRFRLPWGAGASQYLTQDANDACCSDHVGANKYAFDFALPEGGAFDVVAPADGTLVHVKMSSAKGCGDVSCVSDANYVVIDHGDGTQTTMLHLAQGSLDAAVACGGFVRRGQRIPGQDASVRGAVNKDIVVAVAQGIHRGAQRADPDRAVFELWLQTTQVVVRRCQVKPFLRPEQDCLERTGCDLERIADGLGESGRQIPE